MAYRSGRGGRSSDVSSSRRVHSNNNNSSEGRRVTPATSLSSRFQQVHNVRRERATVSNHSRGSGIGNSGVRKARSARPARMDIDEGNNGQAARRGRNHIAGSPRGNRGGDGAVRRGGRGGGRGGRNRGGRRGGAAGGAKGRLPLNKDKLDMDLDNYMMTDNKAGRSVLDNDLDSYMQNPTV